MKKLVVLLPIVFVFGCSVQRSLVSSDGKSSITDSNPMDTVVSISDGPGCPVSVDPYVPPPVAPTPTVMMGTQRMCDPSGGNCKDMMVSARAVGPDPTICNTVVTQTKGLGFAPYMAVGASIFAMIGLALGGF